MDRQTVYNAVMRTFDHQDLLPVERRMIDTVIDETIMQVVNNLHELESTAATHEEKPYFEPGINYAANEVIRHFLPRPECPDGGTCHHNCFNQCFRVKTCEPLSNVFPDDKWPDREGIERPIRVRK